jgi:2-polyprenyl-6-methoxyphenol hydroxylase-like FAD-dependent oxidoreductase
MRYTDVAIVGGGLAGSTAAAMLGHAGIPAVMIDPHTIYPPELRCEKLGGDQIDLLHKTGLADATLRATTLDGEVWEAVRLRGGEKAQRSVRGDVRHPRQHHARANCP